MVADASVPINPALDRGLSCSLCDSGQSLQLKEPAHLTSLHLLFCVSPGHQNAMQQSLKIHVKVWGETVLFMSHFFLICSWRSILLRQECFSFLVARTHNPTRKSSSFFTSSDGCHRIGPLTRAYFPFNRLHSSSVCFVIK